MKARIEMRARLIAAVLAMAHPALAQEVPPAAPPPPPSAPSHEVPGPPAKSWAHLPGNPDMSGFVAQVDTDKDGKMSRAEWLAAGLPLGPFNGMADGRDFVTEEDYDTTPAPPGIDLDGDGKLSVTEFIWFDQKVREDRAKVKPNAPQAAGPGR